MMLFMYLSHLYPFIGGKEGSKTVDMHGKTPQGRPVTGVRPQVQQQQPQMQPPHWNAQYNVKQAG